jgi:hypothetical protein
MKRTASSGTRLSLRMKHPHSPCRSSSHLCFRSSSLPVPAVVATPCSQLIVASGIGDQMRRHSPPLTTLPISCSGTRSSLGMKHPHSPCCSTVIALCCSVLVPAAVATVATCCAEANYPMRHCTPPHLCRSPISQSGILGSGWSPGYPDVSPSESVLKEHFQKSPRKSNRYQQNNPPCLSYHDNDDICYSYYHHLFCQCYDDSAIATSLGHGGVLLGLGGNGTETSLSPTGEAGVHRR